MRLLQFAVFALGAWVATFLLLSGPYPRPDEGPSGEAMMAYRHRPDGGTDPGSRTVTRERESWGAFGFLSLRYETARDEFGVVEPATYSRRVLERTVDPTAAAVTVVGLAVVWGCVAVLDSSRQMEK